MKMRERVRERGIKRGRGRRREGGRENVDWDQEEWEVKKSGRERGYCAKHTGRGESSRAECDTQPEC